MYVWGLLICIYYLKIYIESLKANAGKMSKQEMKEAISDFLNKLPEHLRAKYVRLLGLWLQFLGRYGKVVNVIILIFTCSVFIYF